MKNFIDITGAILITGFIIWVIAKVEIILKGRFHPKNSNGIVKKERVVFFRRHKRAFLIGLAVVIFLIVGLAYYSRSQDNLACLQRIKYRPTSSGAGFYRIDNDNFKTQDEAMEYCLKVIK